MHASRRIDYQSVKIPPSLWPAVARVAGASWPPPDAGAAQGIVEQALREGLLPLLFHSEKQLPGNLAAALVSFRAMQRAQGARAEAICRVFRRVSGLLEREELVVIKGLDYAHRLYPATDLRPMVDIDLLVRRDAIDRVCNRLREAGFEQLFPRGPISRHAGYHERVFHIDGVTVEPHHSFLQRTRLRVDYDEVWRRTLPAEICGMSVRRLGDVEAILYHALSLASNEFEVVMGRYVDITLLLDVPGVDLAAVIDTARRWRMERALYGALRQTATLFPERAPQIEPLITQLLSPAVRQRIDQRVLPSPYARDPLSRRDQVLRKLRLIDRTRERAAFVLYQVWASLAVRLATR